MSKSTISTFELFALFPDAETARTYLEGRLWPNGPRCPVCGIIYIIPKSNTTQSPTFHSIIFIFSLLTGRAQGLLAAAEQ